VLKFLVVIWILAIIEASPLLLENCDAYLDPRFLTWTHSNNRCGEILGFYNDIIIGCTIIGTIAMLDVFTFLRIRYNNKMAQLLGIHVLQTDNKKFKQEVRFFIQALTADCLLITIKLGFSFIAPRVAATSRWLLFVFIPLAVCAFHIANPLIIILLNKETKRLLFKPTKLIRAIRTQSAIVTSQS